MPSHDGADRDESRKERVDREMLELLNELRVALPGVQVLFAFLLTVPAAQHRVLFRQPDKEQLLQRSNRYAFAGLVVLAIAITTAVVLVVDFLFGRPQSLLTGGAVSALLAWLWVTSPLLLRRRASQDHG